LPTVGIVADGRQQTALTYSGAYILACSYRAQRKRSTEYDSSFLLAAITVTPKNVKLVGVLSPVFYSFEEPTGSGDLYVLEVV